MAISTSDLLCRLYRTAGAEPKLRLRDLLTTLTQAAGLIGACVLLHAAVT